MTRMTPENFQVIEAHEPAASNAIADTSDAIKLTNANGAWIVIHEDYAVDATPLQATVHEGATAAEAAAGTYALAVAWPIWSNLACQTNDTFVKRTDAITYSLDSTAGDNIIVIFYIAADTLTDGRDWIHLGFTAGNGGNLASAIYILDGMRYPQGTPPTAVA